ncbi:cytochrome P450 monooxygenase [Zalerion maritima]|uniref:Cytochrome P450 monooxygenase n=1 Tax=Zalerion maritima TaxID=339359 RepID=A0AAD5RMJ2_9PEZI|nr:cytochrome P450 monooxygenase [Zalerion maritima]
MELNIRGFNASPATICLCIGIPLAACLFLVSNLPSLRLQTVLQGGRANQPGGWMGGNTQVLRRAYGTPIRTVPGPWYAKLTQLWLKKHTLAGRRMHYVHSLHEKYGPVVRISPSEIDVSDPAAFKIIHRINSGFLKSPWYASFRTGDTRDLFSMTNPKQHAERRKLFAPVFSNSALRKNWHGEVAGKVAVAVGKIKADAATNGGGEVDIFKWWTYMATDVISQLAFGEAFGMLEQGKKTKPMQKIEESIKFGLISSELPLLCRILQWVPLKAVQDMVNANELVQAHAEATMRRVRHDSLGASNIFSRIVAEQEKGGGRLSDYDVAFEAGGFIVAGSGTTAVTLTYLVWAVLSRPAVQARLESEVAGLEDGFTDVDLEKLPYLSAVIEETLRLYGAAPGALPRTVPHGGATLGEYFIPEGTTVSTQAYTLHRDKASYAEPERFAPDRFLSATGEFQPTQAVFCPFGAGSRTCVGMHLAFMELRHGVAQFFRECKGARLSAKTTPASMDMANYFLIGPAADQCWVTLG